ncbi:hypothetical protein ASG42_11255 [Rhizobium sp. Leaf391]|uniref:AAA family ATPase n=1 Tax=Rhizobium sp. Leaf391 TaxID=1736360 RepID=UPI0007129C9E|nr:AAA family ATPase [Rhizobium sp. Leaf391]KQS91061.1 hypothetical protein ASG42_11255 [Rhizobium sp. Leaf391]
MTSKIQHLKHLLLQDTTRTVHLEKVIHLVRVARALRPLKRARAYVAGFVVDDIDDANDLHLATIHWLTRGNEEQVFHKANILVSTIEKELEKQNFSDFEFGRSVTAFFSVSEHFGSELLAACDYQAYVPPASIQDVKIAMYYYRDYRLSDADAELILRYRSRLQAIFPDGRPVERSLAVLKDMDNPARLGRFDRIRPAKGSVEKVVREVDDPTGPRLEQLSGYGEAQDWGLDLAKDLQLYKAGRLNWSQMPKGLLLSGPPGCGKTTYAQALARTCGVKLTTGSYGEWAAGHGQTDLLKKMRKTFERAAVQAPCILFIDEIDSFPDRDTVPEWGAVWERQVVNGLLELIDGVGSAEGIIVVGACNNPSIVDPALKRAGRLDHHIEIPLPDTEAREGIIRHHLRKAGCYLALGELDEAAYRTSGENGASLEKIVRDAVRRARRLGRQVTVGDVLESLPERIILSEEYMRRASVHEVGHALVGCVVGKDKLEFCAIAETLPTSSRDEGAAGGGVKFESAFGTIRTKAYYLGQIATMLAASAAEEMIYGDAADGRTHDLAQATNFATMVEVHLGYGATLISEPESDHKTLQAMRLRDRDIQRRVEATLREQMERARSILEEHRDLVVSLADLLYREKSIEPSTIYRALEKHKMREAC